MMVGRLEFHITTIFLFGTLTLINAAITGSSNTSGVFAITEAHCTQNVEYYWINTSSNETIMVKEKEHHMDSTAKKYTGFVSSVNIETLSKNCDLWELLSLLFLSENDNSIHTKSFKNILQNYDIATLNKLMVINNFSSTLLNLAVRRNKTMVAQMLIQEHADPYLADEEGNTALHNAVINRNLQIILLITNQNTKSINKINNKNETALIISAKLNYSEIFTLLLNKGADPYIKNSENQTTLHFAASNGNINITMAVLNKSNVGINMQDKSGHTPIFLAARYNNIQICMVLLKYGALPYIPNNIGATALHESILKNHSEIAELILNNSIYGINVKDNNGATPIFVAATKNFTELCELLLKNKAQPFITNKYNKTALHQAVIQRNLEIVKLIINRSNEGINIQDSLGATALNLAAKNNATNICTVLLNAGAKGYISDNRGNAPLHFASELKNLNTVKLIIKSINGFINGKNEKSKTSLHIATQQNHSGIVQVLLGAGADPGAVDDEGNTPLHTCVKNNLFLIAELLLNNNNSIVNKQNNLGETPLHLACRYNRTEIFTLLLKKGAIPLKDNRGSTPLHESAAKGNSNFISTLLLIGESINIQNNAGDTPLHLSAGGNSIDTIKLLLKNYADPEKTNYEVQTPLHIAAKGKNTLVLYEILKYSGTKALNTINIDRNTPLHLAAANSDEALEAILKKDADLFVFPPHYDTPLHVAVSQRKINRVKKILYKFPRLINQIGTTSTPLHKAASTIFSCDSALIEHLLLRGANPLLTNTREENIFNFAAFRCNETTLERLYNFTEEFSGVKNLKSDLMLKLVNNEDILGISPIMESATGANMGGFSFFTQKGSKLDHTDSNGCPLLYSAAFGGNKDIVEYIMDQGNVSVDAACTNGMTPLMAAASKGNVQAFKYLLTKGANISAVNSYGNTLLHYAASAIYPNFEIMNIILNHPQTDVNAQNVEGFSPLMFAVSRPLWNYFRLCSRLLMYGADPLMINKYGDNSITLAAKGEYLDVLQLLGSHWVNYNADVLSGIILSRQKKIDKRPILNFLLRRSSIAKYPLFLAAALGDNKKIISMQSNGFITKKFPELMKEFLKKYSTSMSQLLSDEDENEMYESRLNPLDIALIYFGNINTAKILIDKFKINCSSLNYRRKMWTSIDFAMFTGATRTDRSNPIVHYLLSLCKHCLSEITNDYGWTLVHKAVWTKNIHALQFLHSQGVELDQADFFGRTPLHIAAIKGEPSILSQFLGLSKKSINRKDIHGFTPLHLAQLYQYEKFFSFLSTATITMPPSVKFKSIQIVTGFSYESASSEGHLVSCEILIDNGADIDAQDRAFGWTPLHWASAAGSLRNVALLISKGAKVNIDSWTKETAMMLARIWGRKAVYNYLKKKNGVW